MVRRSVRGRLAMLLPGMIVALFGVLARRVPDQVPGGELFSLHGHALLGFGVLFSFYVMHAFHLNQFAVDREGLLLQFLLPLSDRELLRGKAIGGAAILAVPLALCTLAAALVAPGGPRLVWAAVLLGAVSIYALLAPAAAALSIVFPQRADINKTGSGGNPHPLSLVVAIFLTMLLAAPPVGILFAAFHLRGSAWTALVLAAAWAAFSIAVAIPALRFAEGLLAARRENLVLVARER
jgi:hypothetical protein